MYSPGAGAGPKSTLFTGFGAVLFLGLLLLFPVRAKKKFECENRFTGCHYPPAQAARCAARLANLLKIDTIFLTTDAPEEKVSAWAAGQELPRKGEQKKREETKRRTTQVAMNPLWKSENFRKVARIPLH